MSGYLNGRVTVFNAVSASSNLVPFDLKHEQDKRKVQCFSKKKKRMLLLDFYALNR
jgi:hypothetical protein